MQWQPQRTCIGCNLKKDKKKLIRIAKNKNNDIDVDTTGKMQGRGAYLCNNIECLEKAKKTKKLERTLKIKISDEIYEKIRGVILDK